MPKMSRQQLFDRAVGKWESSAQGPRLSILYFRDKNQAIDFANAVAGNATNQIRPHAMDFAYDMSGSRAFFIVHFFVLDNIRNGKIIAPSMSERLTIHKVVKFYLKVNHMIDGLEL